MALWLRSHPCMRAYDTCVSQHRHDAFVEQYSPAKCAMSRPVNAQSCSVCFVPSGHRSASKSGAVVCRGSTAHHSTIRNNLSSSVGSLSRGCRQGRNCTLFSDRPMPFKRSTLLWLAGAFIVSAVAAQNGHGKVKSLLGHAIHQQGSPHILAHHAGLANSRSILVIGIERTNSNPINWNTTNEEPCQHHFVLSSKG